MSFEIDLFKYSKITIICMYYSLKPTYKFISLFEVLLSLSTLHHDTNHATIIFVGTCPELYVKQKSFYVQYNFCADIFLKWFQSGKGSFLEKEQKLFPLKRREGWKPEVNQIRLCPNLKGKTSSGRDLFGFG